MCDLCRGPDGPADKGISRRQWMAMGASLMGGIALGLWSCRDQGSVPTTQTATSSASGTASASASTSPSASAASRSQTPSSATTPATSQPTSNPQSATSASTPTTTNAAATGPAPELGVEVFPDSAGRPLAKVWEAPVIVVPRTEWTQAKPRMNEIVLMNGIGRITVHHSAGLTETDAWNPTANMLEGIREFHSGTKATDRGWADIAYHFAVDRAGRVWQARPLVYQGAHARQHNEHNLGIVLLGDFEKQSPSAAQLISLGLFVGFVRKLYAVPLTQVFTHGELVETECPGKQLQAFMDRHRMQAADTEGVAWKPAATRPLPDASVPAMFGG